MGAEQSVEETPTREPKHRVPQQHPKPRLPSPLRHFELQTSHANEEMSEISDPDPDFELNIGNN